MKRLLLLFVFLLSCVSVFAQKEEYSIIVKDIETLEPIQNATVIIMKTQQILLSNEEGKVTFMLTGGSNIQVSETNYENLTVRWTSLNGAQKFVIYLKSKNNKLDEVVLSKESPEKILQKLVNNSIKKISTSHRQKVYVREFFMLDNQYTYYNDGLVNFQFDKNNNATTLLVEQNRSYGLLEADISSDLKGYNLNNIMENYLNFKYLDPLLDSKSKKAYDFTIKGHSTNKDYYVMSVIPLDKAKEAIDNFEIIYDPLKKLIVEFTISVTPASLDKIEEKTKEGEKNMTKSFVNVAYRLNGDDYYLLNSNEEIGYTLVQKEKSKNIQVRNCFVTTGFNKQNFTYDEGDVFKEKSLFNKKNKILTNYWDISGFTATDQEKAIIASLEFKL
ncbi:hypothetical protein [uncultured Flavobacterium sp.]|uniref:hypothetical protein n=1 Tax=uncultured Flavobacterium sp. TaxID=165435 RepID=UPI0025F26DAB|nr:hypothetical protein [uncultured Flavobacterium sp.]